MNFGDALQALKDDKKVQRSGWNGKGMYLWLCKCEGELWQSPDGHTYERNSYIYMKTAQNSVVPWLASQTDLLAEDWQVVK